MNRCNLWKSPKNRPQEPEKQPENESLLHVYEIRDLRDHIKHVDQSTHKISSVIMLK